MNDLIVVAGVTVGLAMSFLLAWAFFVLVGAVVSRDRRAFEAGRVAGQADAKLDRAEELLDGLLHHHRLSSKCHPEDRSAAQASTEPQGHPLQSLSRWGQGETQNVGGSSMERRSQE